MDNPIKFMYDILNQLSVAQQTEYHWDPTRMKVMEVATLIRKKIKEIELLLKKGKLANPEMWQNHIKQLNSYVHTLTSADKIIANAKTGKMFIKTKEWRINVNKRTKKPNRESGDSA